MNLRVPPRFSLLAKRCQQVVVVPYALTIVDCYFMWLALTGLRGPQARFATELGGAQGSTTLTTAYDIYDFDRDIDEQEACMFDPDSGAFIYWDEFERFVSVGGSADFCKTATPYPPDVRRHYFLEGMKPQVDPDESDKLYSLLAVD